VDQREGGIKGGGGGGSPPPPQEQDELGNPRCLTEVKEEEKNNKVKNGKNQKNLFWHAT